MPTCIFIHQHFVLQYFVWMRMNVFVCVCFCHFSGSVKWFLWHLFHNSCVACRSVCFVSCVVCVSVYEFTLWAYICILYCCVYDVWEFWVFCIKYVMLMMVYSFWAIYTTWKEISASHAHLFVCIIYNMYGASRLTILP